MSKFRDANGIEMRKLSGRLIEEIHSFMQAMADENCVTDEDEFFMVQHLNSAITGVGVQQMYASLVFAGLTEKLVVNQMLQYMRQNLDLAKEWTGNSNLAPIIDINDFKGAPFS